MNKTTDNVKNKSGKKGPVVNKTGIGTTNKSINSINEKLFFSKNIYFLFFESKIN